MKKVIGFFLILTVISVVIHSVDSQVSLFVPAEKTSQLVAQEMVLIPAGEFQIEDREFQISSGDIDEGKWVVPSPVYISAFYIDKYEVTNAHYKEFVDANPEWSKANIDKRFHNGYYLAQWEGNTYPNEKGNHPVESVSWYGAMAYAKWKGKRLPTVAEWEKAARGGLEGQQYSWDTLIDLSQANYPPKYDDVGRTKYQNYMDNAGSTPVGTYLPNGYGVYDMVGNVSEWCLDKDFGLFFMVSQRQNPVAGVGDISHLMNNFTSVSNYYGHAGGLRSYGRSFRGGSYFSRSYRNSAMPSYTGGTRSRVGFRCVRDIKPGEEVQPPGDVSIPKSEIGKPKITENRGTDTEKLVDKQKVVKPQQQVVRDKEAEVRRKNSTEGMVLIPAGEFRMGTEELATNDSKPVHTVYLKAFYIDQREVTVGEYKEFLRATKYARELHSGLSEYSSSDNHPIIGVSWHDAMAYATWAGKRLPTEAEWEKAARGGLKNMRYPWGNDTIDSAKANYGSIYNGTVAVGSYPPNNYNLYDMAGNVAEWCLDPWDSNFYVNSPTRNPFAGHKSLEATVSDFKSVVGLRVIRGGSWSQNSPPTFWVSGRLKEDSMKRISMSIGFRCAKDAPR